jgi:serine/threonine protein kinase
MSQMDHPNILAMNGCAQDRRIVYIYLEFMKGGDLINVINKFKKLDIEHCKFYVG